MAAPPIIEIEDDDTVETLLEHANVLRERGDLVDASSILLDLLENHNTTGDNKLRMHQGLAEIGRELGWLYGTSR